MKSPDSAAAVVLGSLGALSVVALTLAYFNTFPESDALSFRTPDDGPLVLPIDSKVLLSTVLRTIDDVQQSLLEEAVGKDIDRACFDLHMNLINMYRTEIAQAEAHIPYMSPAERIRAEAFINQRLAQIQNEILAIRGLFPTGPHGVPAHYCT